MPKRSIDQRVADAARFIRTWFANPLLLGAVTPSGPALVAAMAAAVDPTPPGPIVELGPGTGVMTEALLARGIEAGRLILIEFEPSFCALLMQRFPGVHVIQGDAYALRATLGDALKMPPAAVVSSLPLLMKPEPMRIALLAAALDLMGAGAPFVQFTYGLTSPIPPAAGGGFDIECSPWIWRNVPPARVWTYRRTPASGGAKNPAVEARGT